MHKLGPVPLGNAVLAMAVAMSLGALAYGSLDRAFGRRKLFVVLGSSLTAAGFALLAFKPMPALTSAIATIALIGFAGLSHPLLFTHARTFFPDHLLGRGITFANFLSIGGAGLVHFASGAFVAHLQASNLPPAEVYAALHMAFAATIIGGVAIYLTSPANPDPAVAHESDKPASGFRRLVPRHEHVHDEPHDDENRDDDAGARR